MVSLESAVSSSQNADITTVQAYWDRRPCNIRHSNAPVGTREYFEEVEARKYFVEPHIPGRRFRNIRVSCLVEQLSTDRVALPAWVVSYRYRDRPYRAVVHGQRPEVVFGDSPIDWGKVLRLVLAVLALAAVIAALVLLTRR